MLKRSLVLIALLAVAVPGASIGGILPTIEPSGTLRAGAAVVDASWHVGASQGQYADTREVPGEDVEVDPFGHSTYKALSYGLGSEITTRALIVEDADGDRVAVVTNDLYIPQDLLTRRVGSLLAEHDVLVAAGLKDGPIVGVPADNLAVTVSHSHSSPYYSTPSWGVWLFQDVFDVRFFEYMAQRMADAVIAAAADMRPARIGGATTSFNEITSHTYGPKVGDDGTPAGQPWNFTTGRLTIVRVDDLSGDEPAPLATWLIHAVHPEWVEGDGLLNGDIKTATYRMLDREIGGVTLWSERETGTAGPHKDLRAHPPEARREFQDMKFSALDRAARLLADAVEATYDAVEDWSAGEGTPEFPNLFAPFRSDIDVAATSVRVAPPATRPYPGISNCNTKRAFEGDPGVPIVGLPDCGFFFGDLTDPIWSNAPVDIAGLYDELRAMGAPVPTSYSPTAFGGLEETIAVHLQAFKLGDIGVTFSPIEQFTDAALNVESRLDLIDGNVWTGFDWAEQTTPANHAERPEAPWCEQNADETWTCANPQNTRTDLAPVSDLAYRTMRAQIHNDAAGWEDLSNAPGAESEPIDPDEIKGNFTHAEATANGFKLPVSVGMANDYWGYMPPYREYRAHDHYRKALSALGPHGADFVATRLVAMATGLNDGPGYEPSALDLAYQAESARAQSLADALGAISRSFTTTYEAQLPNDAGEAGIVSQPSDIRRFDAAFVRWIGGNTWDDMPRVRVERLGVDGWERFGDQAGEVQTLVRFPTYSQLPQWRAGEFSWEWTESFEAFVSELENLGTTPGITPVGTYRFVIDGEQRRDGATLPYHLESDPFEVSPWAGITVEDLGVSDGDVSFDVDPSSSYTFGTPNTYRVGPIDYPDSYASPFRFIRNERRLYTYGLSDPARHQQYCARCSFRPWADSSEVVSATVTVVRADDSVEQIAASFDGARWVADTNLQPGDRAFVAAGGLIDQYGETNGTPSSEVS